MKRKLLFLLAALMLVSVLTACGGEEDAPSVRLSQSFDPTGGAESESETAGETTAADAAETGVTLPYELADGRLIVRSFFQSTMPNLDGDGELGDDLGTLEVENVSGQFLTEARITVRLADGADLTFVITNLPAGRTVWVFNAESASIDLQPECAEIVCEADFASAPDVMSESLSFEVDGTVVTVTNLTDEPITGLTVGCHCLMENICLGGVTFTYPVDDLPANGSASFNADDCYFGTAEIVSAALSAQ